MATTLTNPTITGKATQTLAATGATHLVRKGEMDAAVAAKADTTDARLSDARTPTGAAGGDLAGNFPNPTLAAAGTAGTYTKVTTDAKGRVIAGTTLSASDLPAHASRHAASGADELKISDLQKAAADVDLNSHKLVNVTNPTGAQDAATKAYVDARRLDQAAAPSADVDLNSHKLVNVTNPSGAQDAATKAYVDARRLDQAAAPSADVDLNSHKLTGVATPTVSTDAATKAYVDARRLDQAALPTGSVSLNGQKLTGVLDPTSAQDAATMAYVDAKARGLTQKASCRVATTANIALTGLQTVDAVVLLAGDRALVKSQTTASQNGIYVAAVGAWSRAADADEDAEVVSGMFTFISEGTVNGNNGFSLITANPITVNTTNLTFTQSSGAGQITAGTGLSKSGNTLSVVTGTTAGTICAGDDARLSDARTPTGAAGGDLATTYPNPTLAAAGTAGTYTKVTTDAKGRIIAGTTLSASDLPAHASRHAAGGADELKISDLQKAAADVDLNSHKLVNVTNPTGAQDAATKAYVDAAARGLVQKAACRLATTTNHALTGLAAIDSITPIAGDRVLVKLQTTASQNGIYVAAAGAWTRATDADEDAEVVSGLFTFVSEGSTNGNNGYTLITANPIVVGTTALTFTQSSGAGQITAGTGLSKSGNTLTVVTGTTAGTICAGDDARLSDARTPTGAAGGDLAGTFPSPTLAAAGTAGTYTKVTTDAKGRIIAGTTLSAGDLPAHATSHKSGGGDAIKLNELAAPTGSVALNAQKLTGVLDPTSAQDAATKAYVDATIGGVDVKASCRLATTANHALTGLTAIDGGTPVAGDRVLVKSQTTGSQNGIYIAAAGAWSRATDADANAEVTSGLFTFVSEGTANGGNGFVLTTADPIVVGTTALTFTQFSGAGQITAGTGITKTGNTLAIDFTTSVSSFAAPSADFDVNTHKLINVVDPTSAQQAATKNYVDTRKVTDLTAPTGSFSMNNQKITNLLAPTSSLDAANKTYVDNGNRTGNLVWVDAVNGSDSTGARGFASLPFLTLSAAKTAAVSGDTIVVLPGSYSEAEILKNGVNLHFLAGAVVTYTGSLALLYAASALTCVVTGHGKFICPFDESPVLMVSHASADVTVEALELSAPVGDGSNRAILMTAGKLRVRCAKINALAGSAIELNGGTSIIRADEIVCTGATGLGAVTATKGTHSIYADTITGSGDGVHASNGDNTGPLTLNVTAREIVGTAGYGVRLAADGDGPQNIYLTLNGARVVSKLATASGIAAYLSADINGNHLILKDCVLVSNTAGTPATVGIDAANAQNVRIYGALTGNLAKGANITFITGSYTADADVI